MFKFMKIGLGLEVVKLVIGNLNTIQSKPLQFLRILPSQINCQLPAFLITYAGLYRVHIK